MLDIRADGGGVTGLALERMGTVSQPTTISYLTDGYTFVGSSMGDSQLVRLLTEPTEDCFEYVSEVSDHMPSRGGRAVTRHRCGDVARRGSGVARRGTGRESSGMAVFAF